MENRIVKLDPEVDFYLKVADGDTLWVRNLNGQLPSEPLGAGVYHLLVRDNGDLVIIEGVPPSLLGPNHEHLWGFPVNALIYQKYMKTTE